jgi:hypothetical protein
VRLDHLLSKEHHYRSLSGRMVGRGCVEAKPIAQASVLRWVLMGGISADSGRFVFVLCLVRMPFVLFRGLCRGAVGGVVERCGAGRGRFSCLAHCWVLRQQGRGWCVACRGCVSCSGFGCFWFPGCMACACVAVLLFLWGGGVVWVRGCGTGLLFENYIVDASI